MPFLVRGIVLGLGIDKALLVQSLALLKLSGATLVGASMQFHKGFKCGRFL